MRGTAHLGQRLQSACGRGGREEGGEGGFAVLYGVASEDVLGGRERCVG